MSETDAKGFSQGAPAWTSFSSLPVSIDKDAVSPGALVYPIREETKGLVVIFNHFEYDENLKLSTRKGTENDAENLKKTFTSLNFKVKLCQDYKYDEITKEIEELKEKKQFLQTIDCLIIIVLSHGFSQHVFAKDKIYRVDSFWKSFYGNHCLELAGKPKIFIIQACRIPKENKNVLDNSKSFSYVVPVEADILIGYSTYDEKVSHRIVDSGTWYIIEVCKEIKENGKKEDFLSMMTNVNRRVAVGYDCMGSKQMPVIESTLIRKLYLTQRVEKDNQDQSRAIENVEKRIESGTNENMPTISGRTSRTSSTSSLRMNFKVDDDYYIKAFQIFLNDNPFKNKQEKIYMQLFLCVLKEKKVSCALRKKIINELIDLIKKNTNWKYGNLLVPLGN